jgi:hypothetical protein
MFSLIVALPSRISKNRANSNLEIRNKEEKGHKWLRLNKALKLRRETTLSHDMKSALGIPVRHPPKVLIGGAVREFAGIPVKACGNDETELPALIQHLRRSHLDGRLLLFGFGQVAVSSLLAPCFGFRVCASDLFLRLPKALLAEWNRGQLLL